MPVVITTEPLCSTNAFACAHVIVRTSGRAYAASAVVTNKIHIASFRIRTFRRSFRSNMDWAVCGEKGAPHSAVCLKAGLGAGQGETGAGEETVRR